MKKYNGYIKLAAITLLILALKEIEQLNFTAQQMSEFDLQQYNMNFEVITNRMYAQLAVILIALLVLILSFRKNYAK
ncbi:hypothetical protein [Flavobacterium cyclinae]|uniref:hypothetical protein n=1 Tax=Flavobacterium cyclinae TaxID=2895947 RepID=UPI001E454BDC|nr:hypothetical protein [Flavobacterium cyclinae]UGS19816.1 hypothetical protein LOS86_07230 [Flavobacterium cyclinae]